MAVKFYGACVGSVASDYTVYINVIRNFSDQNLDLSNYTIDFCLKKNNPDAADVYSKNSSGSSVGLTVNGNAVVSESLAIDTTNNKEIILASWTGDISNKDNGDAKLDVAGDFNINSELLSSGSVQAVYKSTEAPKATALVLSTSVVSPGSEIKADFDGVSSEYSHRIAWGIGGQSVSVNYEAGVSSAQFVIPVEWAQEITSSKKGDFKVAIRTYYGSTIIGTNVYTLEFVVPETAEFKPDFEIGLKKADTAVPDNWNLWVQGISKMEVVPESLSLKYGATLSAITITVGSVSKRSLPAVFDLTEPGNVTVTLAVRDSRGMLTVKSVVVEVQEYSAPSVDVRQLHRCFEDGTINSAGESLTMECIVGCSSVKGCNSCKLTVKYRPTDYLGYSGDVTVTSTPFIFGNGDIKSDKSYVICVTVSDDINTIGTDVIRRVSSADIPFNIRKGGNGAAFGKHARYENELSVKWNLSVDGDLDFKGELLYENVTCECSPLAENLVSDVRYYHCLGMVFLRLRFTTTTAFSANDTYYVATVSERCPGLFMPLNSIADFSSGGQSTAGITYRTGMITFRSDVPVPQGTTIYISGFYVADYSE